MGLLIAICGKFKLLLTLHNPVDCHFVSSPNKISFPLTHFCMPYSFHYCSSNLRQVLVRMIAVSLFDSLYSRLCPVLLSLIAISRFDIQDKFGSYVSNLLWLIDARLKTRALFSSSVDYHDRFCKFRFRIALSLFNSLHSRLRPLPLWLIAILRFSTQDKFVCVLKL